MKAKLLFVVATAVVCESLDASHIIQKVLSGVYRHNPADQFISTGAKKEFKTEMFSYEVGKRIGKGGGSREIKKIKDTETGKEYVLKTIEGHMQGIQQKLVFKIAKELWELADPQTLAPKQQTL
ncbi:MAG: uncharacterized protein A8A55_1890 [Amphiamblys sp. WSBS2006]|nr:MAG: uncharacterized protein A8A55_1890 [Amphiamblys sp. WSBS2006]